MSTTSYNGGAIGAAQAYFSGARDFSQVPNAESSDTPYAAGGLAVTAFALQLQASFTALSVTVPATASEQTMLATIVAGLLDGKSLTDVSTSIPNSYVQLAEIAALAYQEFLVKTGTLT